MLKTTKNTKNSLQKTAKTAIFCKNRSFIAKREIHCIVGNG